MTLPDPEQLTQELALAIKPRLRANSVLVGIHTGGAWIAEKIQQQLGGKLPLGTLDISFYRDDFSRIGLHPQVAPSDIPFEIEDAHVILIDDVLHTGRTIRAAMNELYDYGRPASIELAVLIDRGGRELPIAADMVGARLDLTEKQNIQLTLDPNNKLTLSLHQR
ncbi:MAG: bifunctional pyr operon transcriptional regulator/uracil phosphoribosyltransferase PyrR [Hydrogenophilales bacterium]|nr:bifunctional pyr operon transcriptional regulator/uracil phosphoribosyltransferase PyrR [Hydrogenophilales bacterium]